MFSLNILVDSFMINNVTTAFNQNNDSVDGVKKLIVIEIVKLKKAWYFRYHAFF